MLGTMAMVGMLLCGARDGGEGWRSGETRALPLRVEVVGFAGTVRLHRSRWAALVDQPEAGALVTVTHARRDSIGLAADVLLSRRRVEAPGYTFAGQTRELALGMRGRIGQGRLHAVAGGGVSLLQTEAAASWEWATKRSSTSAPGLWWGIGLRMPLTESLVAGVDLRQSIGMSLVDRRAQHAGGFHAGASVGVRFGGAR